MIIERNKEMLLPDMSKSLLKQLVWLLQHKNPKALLLLIHA